MATRDDRVTVECRVLDEVGKALLIEVPDGLKVRRIYLPLSTIHEIHKHDGLVVVDAWIARREGLE